ncbi:MAG: efflux RND transporter periplasmic adaptor subunit [Planctomycetota bacterium]
MNVGSGIVEFPDLSAMKVKINIPETLVRHFAVDDRVAVELEKLPDEKLGGRIMWIDTWARDKNAELAAADMEREGLSGVRVFRADIALDRTDKRLRLGSKARVVLSRTLPEALQVDRRAILRRGGKPFVRVIREGGRVELVPVVLGDANETSYVVKRGPEPGTPVAYAGWR